MCGFGCRFLIPWRHLVVFLGSWGAISGLGSAHERYIDYVTLVVRFWVSFGELWVSFSGPLAPFGRPLGVLGV